ncbi:MAG TPA: ABC transporter permease [Chitinophagales bacterium]|nr:ABC transporter permease [Chitinophagales bacterium]HMZ88255.1 ABC transporter permease [Chitinophagales bacterium]HNA57387.1 ABC transporter permease [Chitinophagales bacterium]HNE45570.1 ABC transporter permease [Chitinophagales bacterium]HNF67769.1 ABC transporter permease [Chitinophagales bacterium]
MWTIAKKDIYIFFKDKRGLFLSLLLPIGLITMFAFAFGGIGQDDEDPAPIHVLYVDADQTTSSKSLIAMLDTIPGIACLSTTAEDATANIKSGDEMAAVVINKGFEMALQTGEDLPVVLQYDQSRVMEIGVLQQLLTSRLSAMKGSVDAHRGINKIMQQSFSNMPPNVQDSIRTSLEENLLQKENHEQLISMQEVVGDAESNWGLIQAVAGTAIMMLLFSVSSIGKSMLDEKESGVLRRLLQTPMHPYGLLFGKMITALVIAVFQLTIMFLFSWLAFGLDIFINIPALIIMILATSLACSAFGVLLASLVTTRKQADSLSTILILFMSAVGGSMIPLFIMPVFMQNAAVVSVNYWSIQGFYDIFWRQAGLEAIVGNALVLTGISAGVLLISMYFYKKNILRLI